MYRYLLHRVVTLKCEGEKKEDREKGEKSHFNKMILTNIFSNDFFASQQFKNTGINKLIKGFQNTWNESDLLIKRVVKMKRICNFYSLRRA